ncbi:hypothetical protein [Lysobacter sp. A289]
MRYLIAIAVATILVVGCSEQSQETAAVDVTSGAPVASTDSTTANSRIRQLTEPLPEGVELAFPYHLRSDRIVEREERSDRRRIGLEYLAGDKESIFAGIEQSLVAAGFEQRERKDSENGNIRAKFDKSKVGIVIVTVTPSNDSKADHSDARGRILLDWPAKIAEDTAPE